MLLLDKTFLRVICALYKIS